MFDTKISIVVREDLATWQKLNVVAFLMSGVIGANAGLIGEPYEDAAGNRYNPLMIQPAIVLSADRETLKTIYGRAMEQRLRFSLYIEDMFATGHDAANRATVKQYAPDAMNVVGLALREDKKLVDKITKGARMHAGTFCVVARARQRDVAIQGRRPVPLHLWIATPSLCSNSHREQSCAQILIRLDAEAIDSGRDATMIRPGPPVSTLLQ
jgi:hypothetical protein